MMFSFCNWLIKPPIPLSQNMIINHLIINPRAKKKLLISVYIYKLNVVHFMFSRHNTPTFL